MINTMKNPKLIDEAWIDEQIQYVGTPNNKYDDALLHVMNLVKSKLQPLPATTKTNVDKIRAGEMAIENDDVEALRKCVDYCFPRTMGVMGVNKYYFKDIYNIQRSSFSIATTLPTIKASELIKEIEGVNMATMYPSDEPLKREFNFTKPDIEPMSEWQPKFGDKITVNLCGEMIDAVCVGDKDGAIYWKTESSFNKNEFWVQNIKYVKPRTPTLTLAEAEAKLGVKIVMP